MPNYFTSSERDAGPIRHFNAPHVIGIVVEDGPVASTGQAELVGWISNDRQPLAIYRIAIGGDELPGLFTCVGRRFIPLEVP